MSALAAEFGLLWRSPGARALLAVWTGLLVYALLDAASFLHARESAIEAHLASRTAANGAAEVLAHRVRTPAALPPAPLTVVSIGQQDLQPFAASVDLLSRPDTLLRGYQLQSPMALAAGRLDATFAVVFLMPLVLFGLVFGQLGEEREHARLALLGVSGASPARLLWRRLAARAIAVAAPLCLLASGAALMVGGPGAGRAFGAWLGVALAYLAFWTTLAALLAGTASTAASAALRLAVAWLSIVLLVPVGARSIADALAPLPTRINTIAEIRAAELEITRRSDDVLGRFMDDHPELAGAGAGGPNAWIRASYARSLALAARVAALEAANERNVASNTRIAHGLAYLSPAALATTALATAAGTDDRRVAAFRRQLADFKIDHDRALLPAAFAGTPVDPQVLAKLPAFAYSEPRQRWPLVPWIALLAYAALGALAATRRVREAPVGMQTTTP
jgi:ABC-2 type transport system permease protein